MKPSMRCVNSLKETESFRPYAYPDPYSPLGKATRGVSWGFKPAAIIIAGLSEDKQKLRGKPWTVGYGETNGIDQHSVMTEMEAAQQLREQVDVYGKAVWDACTRKPNQNELDAMTHFAYNVGIGGFKGSSVLKAHNRGDAQAASRAFGLWNMSQHVVSNGLTIRRAKEGAWYLEPVPGDAPDTQLAPLVPMPQEVDPERPMSSLTINRAGTVAGGTAAVGAAAEVARTVADVKYSVASIGDWLLPIALIAVVGLCGYIVWQRYKIRKDGWA